jgi:hypothetical protein
MNSRGWYHGGSRCLKDHVCSTRIGVNAGAVELDLWERCGEDRARSVAWIPSLCGDDLAFELHRIIRPEELDPVSAGAFGRIQHLICGLDEFGGRLACGRVRRYPQRYRDLAQ